MTFFTNAKGRGVTRRTRGVLDGSFGKDAGRPLYLSLGPDDVITLRPVGSRSAEASAAIAATNLYRLLIKRRHGL
jgi:hypothetical protein